jgi:glucose-6-phosphate isomerase
LRSTFGSVRGFPRLWVLDSVVPGAVRNVTKAIRLARTLFILSSKSGGTVEVMSLFSHFWTLVAKARGNSGGGQFIAITDPNTSLAALAHERGFRTTFINPPEIGGRYSVLSYFGLVPAALLGLDLGTFLGRATEMARACRPSSSLDIDENPGAYLGAVMGALARAGRDKVTIVASPKLSAVGLWIEQLLAESTGKEGKGLIPISGEPLVSPSHYGNDRLFVHLRLNGDANGVVDRHVAALTKAGQPVVRLTLRDRNDLAGQFFCWEFATAVAGHLLGIHPFDQPNVQESKTNTSRILDEVRTGRSPGAESSPARPQVQYAEAAELLAQAAAGDYVALLAYVAPSIKIDAALEAARRAILLRYQVATSAAYGPRYLHSTGQLHKGGPNTGLFLLLVEDMRPDLPVPDAPYTFETLAMAQAVGDLQSLQTHDRRVVRLDLGPRPLAGLRTFTGRLSRHSSSQVRSASRRR